MAEPMLRMSYEALRENPFFDGLTDWQLEQLAPLARRSMFHAGNRVFREGDPADQVWLIERGRVAVDTTVAGQGEVVVDTLGPGAVLGWSWLLPPYRWRFGAVAVQTTHTIALDGSALRELCHADPTLGFQVALGVVHVVTKRLDATRRLWLQAANHRGADQRGFRSDQHIRGARDPQRVGATCGSPRSVEA